MKKCSKCWNENLKEDWNYCPICGAILDCEMIDKAALILNRMLNHHKTIRARDADEERCHSLIVSALSIAINELERTAREVPVKEQSIKVTLDSSKVTKSVGIKERK